MAKQKGPQKLEGFLDGKIYYMMNGQYYVRNSSAPSLKKLKKDPAFKSFGNYGKEFGAASSVASCFRKAFGPVLDSISDTHFSKHVTSIFLKVIHHGKGEQGKRTIEILPNKNEFIGLQFKEEHHFNEIFKAPFTLTCKKNRKEVTLTVPVFNPKGGICKVEGASHFRLMLCLVTFSDYAFDPVAKKYLPIESSLNKMCIVSYTEMISMEGNTSETLLKAKLKIKPELPSTLGVVTCVGVEFYQEVARKPYILESMCCMRISEVF
jgi:hypothetical protein